MEELVRKGNICASTSMISSNFRAFADGRPCVLGIDEAGRGPVLGPMVYACAVADANKADALDLIGAKDSKVLSEAKRDIVFARVVENREGSVKLWRRIYIVVAYAYQVISAQMISAAMYRRRRCSLNDLSHNSAIELIELAIRYGINVSEVYVDTVGPKTNYQEKLQRKFPDLRITVSEKADSKFPIVSVASVIAKVNRDKLIKEWEYEEGQKAKVPKEGHGTGYPADPITKKFLLHAVDKVFGFPSLVRFSWQTADVILNKRAYQCKWADSSAVVTLDKFQKGKKVRPQRLPFYRMLHLNHSGDL